MNSIPWPRNPRAAWLTQLLLVGTVALLGLEIGARLEDLIGYGTPFLNRYRSAEELLVRTQDGVHGRPGARYERWVMNDLGFRGPPADSVKMPGRLRVIAAGASEIFGLYESPGREIPRQLEDSLKARLFGSACAPGGLEVWNAALPGMALATIEQDLRLRVSRFEPDIVVIYPSPPFYLSHQVPTAARPDSSGATRTPGLARALYPRSLPRVRDQVKGLVPSPLATWVRKRQVESVLRKQGPGWQFRELPHERVVEFEKAVRRAVGTVRLSGAIPVLATHGNAFFPGSVARASPEWLTAWEKFHPRATADVLIAFDSASREAVLRVAADSGIMVADVALRIAGSEQLGFADYAHFNDLGAGVAAGVMAEAAAGALRRQGAGDCQAHPDSR